MDKLQIIDGYMKFMWNRFDQFVCERLFGARADHIFRKWIDCRESAGVEGAPAMFWASVSNDVKEAILSEIDK